VAGTDQFVYVIAEEGYWRNHEVSAPLPPPPVLEPVPKICSQNYFFRSSRGKLPSPSCLQGPSLAPTP
jgi:hypothetical protein